MIAKVKSLLGNKCANVFTKVVPMTSCKEAAESLIDFTDDVHILEMLMTNRNLPTLWLDSGSSWLDGVNGILMQQEPDLPKQDYWNWRAIASLANTLITVMEPVPMPLLSSMLLLQL
jgi:hypothetical protein